MSHLDPSEYDDRTAAPTGFPGGNATGFPGGSAAGYPGGNAAGYPGGDAATSYPGGVGPAPLPVPAAIVAREPLPDEGGRGPAGHRREGEGRTGRTGRNMPAAIGVGQTIRIPDPIGGQESNLVVA